MPRILSAADPEAVKEAVAVLSAGEPCVLPTETVYGLAADATNGEAVAKVYALKGRPSFNPLIAHVAGLAMARRLGAFSPLAEALAAAFWPGPLTLVVPARADSPVAGLVAAGLDTIAVRMPAAAFPRKVIATLGRPVAAPSANPFEGISPTTIAHVVRGLGPDAPLVIDGGPCAVGLESTIVAVEGDQILLLRAGAVTREALSAHGEVAESDGYTVRAPGMTKRHYAPTKRLRLNAESAENGEYLIGFGPVGGDETLSEAGDLTEAAANLFSALHRADASAAERIAVAPVPDEGLGAAINDRLRRAAG
ncbi:MAG: L-threonylcarbamoyladenylate synthase [Pacificimonas sp.]|jgi:L-threonylcarbamoyladenylate synthase|nr:L-threonylcarbamoyladenylate synthase [Pacificimonas sp.]